MKESGMSVRIDKKDFFTLSPDEVSFIKHFILSYEKNVNKGNVDQSHHDAVAILLELKRVMEIEL